MLNRAEIIGNLGGEPELRFTQTGKPVANFSVAVNSKYGDKVTTEWFNIVVWNKLAEICNQHCFKGMRVFVEGSIQTRQWESPDGLKHYKTELVAKKVLFLSASKDHQPLPESDAETSEVEPEDIPF